MRPMLDKFNIALNELELAREELKHGGAEIHLAQAISLIREVLQIHEGEQVELFDVREVNARTDGRIY